jgi:phosphonate metabolism protein (transferase hexapeptide repeat family)
MRINQGDGIDPWTAKRTLSERPEIDPSAIIRESEFGRYTYVGADCFIADTVMEDYGYAMGGNQIAHATLGKFCNIASGVRINPSNHPWFRATQHHFTYRSRSYGFALEDDAEVFAWRRQDAVAIGPDVWLGHNAIVMPGVTIGAGVAVGSGSIVTKDIPPYAIAVGVPARVIRFRAEPSVIEAMQRLCWWDWSHAAIEAALPDMRRLEMAAFVAKYAR